MQSKGFIKLFALALVVASVYQLSFTFVARNVEKKAAEYATAYEPAEQISREESYLDSMQNQTVYNLGFTSFTYKEVKERELNLGLDLKGGMNVTLAIEVEDVVKSLAGANATQPAFVEAAAIASEQFSKGESQDYISAFVTAFQSTGGGASLASIFISPERSDINPGSTNSQVEQVLRRETDAAIETSFNILRSRIDHFGVTQPNIQRLPNSDRILVELPGVKEPERVRKLLQGSASLEFWNTYDAREVLQSLLRADQYLLEIKNEGKAEQEAEVVAEQATQSSEGDLLSEVASAQGATDGSEQGSTFNRENNPLLSLLNVEYSGGAVVGAANAADMAQIESYLSMPAVAAMLPSNIAFKWGVSPEVWADGRYLLYAIKVERADGLAPLDGGVVTDAREMYSQTGATAEVSLSMNADGMREWARITGDNIGRCIAIVLDGRVYSAPVIQTRIEGNTSITGNFTIQEAKDLANVLKSGKVPAPARIIQDTVVGPSLGQESIDSGLMSFVIAFILVLLYMGLFYRRAGWMADIALITNVFLLMGVLVSFGAVLTLPGIAGIVLTMGMAVDANVIIFERIKEELRAGKGVAAAIGDGFSSAYSAIIDGNVTTLITAIILALFGTGPVQGFATTTIIGIATSLFCSIFITRLLLEWNLGKFGNVTFSQSWSANFMVGSAINFIAKRKTAYIISSVVIILSLASFGVRGLNLGTEFTGGRSYVISFDQSVSADDIRTAVEDQFANHEDAAGVSLEVKQFGGDNQMRIVTQYKYADTSEQTTEEVDKLIYDAVKPYYGYDISFDGFRFTQEDVNGIITSEKIGPAIARDMTWNASWAILLSLIAIGLYITVRFQKWQWATGATAALIHDALIVLGVFSLMYGVLPFNLEINQAFIAAILTIIGYSINDTVVIFDRIREYIGLYPKRDLGENIDAAINSTIARTINTSCTTLVTLLAIFIFGGETIRGFIFALILGVVIGTYSSLFIATPIAYDMMKKQQSKK